MNLRVYLRLLLPIPALTVSAFLANGAAAFGILFFDLKRPDAYLLALIVALPLLFGMDLASAVHTAMHRPFFPLLPDGTHRLQRATLWAALTAALVLTAATAWFFPAMPVAAVFGLALPLLLLPCLNRRHLVARSRTLHVSVNLGGLQFPALGFAGWALFMWTGAHRLAPAMIVAPWLFFFGGLAGAAGLLQLAFSQHNRHERAGTPFFSTNAMWGSILHPQVMGRAHAEIRQHRIRQGSAHPDAASVPGRPWDVAQVGPRTHDWLKVLWHAAYGIMPRGSFLRAQGLIFLVLLGYALVLPALGFMFALLEHRPFGFAGYLEALCRLSALDIDAVHSAAQAGSMLVGLMLYVGFTFVLALAAQLRPQLPYPVSRERLAQVGLAHALLQLVFAVAIPTAALQLASLAGQLLSGRPQPVLGLTPLLRLDLALIPFLLCVTSAGRLRRVAFRLPALVVLATAVCALVVSQSLWQHWLHRLPGIVALVLASAAALQLLRWQIRRHYRTCDLVNEAALARAFVFGVSFRFSHPPAPAR